MTRRAVPRQLLFGWVTNGYDLSKASSPPTFDCALSLPRVMEVDGDGANPTWEIAPEINSLRLRANPLLLRNLKMLPNATMPLSLPDGAMGDALELRLNFTVREGRGHDLTLLPVVGLSVRATSSGSSSVAAGQSEQTLVLYGPSSSARNGTGLRVLGASRDPGAFSVNVTAPPLRVPPSSLEATYSLRVFVDRSVIETHVNGMLSATVRAYPLSDDAKHAFVVNRGDVPVVIDSLEVWGMGSIWRTGLGPR